MIGKINRQYLKNKADAEHVLPILNVLDQIADTFSNPLVNGSLIRLGRIVVEHTEGTTTEVIGTAEIYNANTYYVPVTPMQIVGAKWCTNIPIAGIAPETLGTLKIISAAYVDSQLVIEELSQPINHEDAITTGLNDQAMYDVVANQESILTLPAFISNYAIQVTINAPTVTGRYAFEVYIQVRYV